ncbi:MAG: CHASE4 domain-containing protein, partial [Sphingomonas sp.]
MQVARLFGRLGAPRSLGAKLLLILTAVGLLGALAITLLLALVITPSFDQLERTAVTAHIQRTRAALGEYISKVESAVRDYGDWNSSYDYVAHPNPSFERESFSPLAMSNLDVNGMAYLRADGTIVIARWLDLASQRDVPAMRNRLVDAIHKINFSQALGHRNSTAFYTRIGPVVAAVGVAQIRRSDGSGTPRGHVLMVRQITQRQLSALLQVEAALGGPNGNNAIITPSAGHMTISLPIRGPDNRAVASARFAVPRDVSRLGQGILLLAVAGSTLLLLMVLFVLRRTIAQLVLAPLNRVEQHMQHVTASGTFGLLAEDDRRDEIGSLGHSFNMMLKQLKDLREQIEVQSFALGRSESAVVVMHNVRNALTPVSTIMSRALGDAPAADAAMLARAAAELARDDIPPARREKLAAFVTAGLEAEGAAHAERQRQLRAGRDAMRHVLEIIGAQQAKSHERPQLAPCDMADILAQNATIARYSGDTAITFDCPMTPCPVLANRVILSQVIGNLFGNAAESIAATGRRHGTIAVSIRTCDDLVEIAIRDDGDGFSEEVGKELFQRGFSTRNHKSGGLGLHWCAN